MSPKKKTFAGRKKTNCIAVIMKHGIRIFLRAPAEYKYQEKIK